MARRTKKRLERRLDLLEDSARRSAHRFTRARVKHEPEEIAGLLETLLECLGADAVTAITGGRLGHEGLGRVVPGRAGASTEAPPKGAVPSIASHH